MADAASDFTSRPLANLHYDGRMAAEPGSGDRDTHLAITLRKGHAVLIKTATPAETVIELRRQGGGKVLLIIHGNASTLVRRGKMPFTYDPRNDPAAGERG